MLCYSFSSSWEKRASSQELWEYINKGFIISHLAGRKLWSLHRGCTQRWSFNIAAFLSRKNTNTRRVLALCAAGNALRSKSHVITDDVHSASNRWCTGKMTPNQRQWGRLGYLGTRPQSQWAACRETRSISSQSAPSTQQAPVRFFLPSTSPPKSHVSHTRIIIQRVFTILTSSCCSIAGHVCIAYHRSLTYLYVMQHRPNGRWMWSGRSSVRNCPFTGNLWWRWSQSQKLQVTRWVVHFHSRAKGTDLAATQPPLLSFFVQLSYRRAKHKEVNTLTAANSTAELFLSEDDDDYIIHIRTLSEGGLGPASDAVRIHQLGTLGVRGYLSCSVCVRGIKSSRETSLLLCEMTLRWKNSWETRQSDNVWHVD